MWGTAIGSIRIPASVIEVRYSLRKYLMFFLKSIAIDQMPTGVGRTKTNVENTIDDSAINFCFIACSLLPADNSPLIFEQSLLICLSHIFGRFPISASYKPSRVLSVRSCSQRKTISPIVPALQPFNKDLLIMVQLLPLSLSCAVVSLEWLLSSARNATAMHFVRL